MTRITEHTRRDRRDELVRQLRGKGWSLRRIGRHPGVQLSASAVHEILNPAVEDDDVGDGAPDAELAVDFDDRMNKLHLLRVRARFDNDVAEALWRQEPPPTFAEAAAHLGVDADWLREQV